MVLTDDELRALEDKHGHGTNGASELPLMRAVEAAVLRKAAAWVPCAERMPGEFEDVLAATGDQERPVVVAHWQPNRETGMNDWFTADMVPTDVFAWMPLPPLPAPPKE